MQAIKDKLSDMNALRHAKAEAKEEEKVEREIAKTRVEVAHEVRLAREAEAAMDLHVNKAAEKVAREEANLKHSMDNTGYSGHGEVNAGNPTHGGASYDSRVHGGDASALPAYGGGQMDHHGGNNVLNTASTMTNSSAGTGYMGNAPNAAR